MIVSGMQVQALHGRFIAAEALRRLIAGKPLAVASATSSMIALRAVPPVSSPAPTKPSAMKRASTKHAQNESDAPATESVIVLGEGSARQMQTMKSIELAKAAPGTSPLQQLNKLPGVDFESSDPLGTYEWAQQITIRGFTTDEMGYTLDGVPLGNMQYRNNNGLSIGRALLTENNGPVTLSQGSGALGTASTSNIGGTIDFTSVDPTEHYSGDLGQTYGSSDTWRTFARLNTGILPTGGRLMLSYAHQNTGKWKGYGGQKQDQFNAKLVQPLGNWVTATSYLDLLDRQEDDYMDVSKSLVQRLGRNVDTIGNNFPLAEALARAEQNGTAVPAPYHNGDDVYYNGGGVRKDLFNYEKLEYSLSPRLSGQTTAYFHIDHGIGTYADPYESTPAAYGGSPVSVSTVGYYMSREGVASRLRYELGQHVIEGGFWFENNDYHQTAQLYGLQEGVTPTDFQRFYSNPFKTKWNYEFNTRTYQFDLGDTWRLTDALKVNAGFKSMITRNTETTIQSTQPINGSVEATDGFLPTAGALYKLNRHNELFADYTRNMAGFVASASSGPFSTTQAGFDYIKDGLKPEKTDTFEAGYRFHNHSVQASLTGYYVSFHDRLLASSLSATMVGNQNVLQNVGGVTSRGVEAAATWQFARHWSLYGSWAFNDATYDDDVELPGEAAVLTKGKQVVDSPRNVGNIQLAYDDTHLWAQLSAHYRSRRFYTYVNDSPIAGAATADLSLGYRLTGAGSRPGLEFMLNLTNLFDKKYYASVGTSGFVDSDPNGTYTTLQEGAPRQIFGSIRAHF